MWGGQTTHQHNNWELITGLKETLPWKDEKGKSRTENSGKQHNREKIFALIEPNSPPFFFFGLGVWKLSCPDATSGHTSSYFRSFGWEINALASVQPHNHAVLKIAASVLIPLLFVIQVQLLFCGGGGATNNNSTEMGTRGQWHQVKHLKYVSGLCCCLSCPQKKRASGAKVEHVAVETAKHQPTFSRLSCHVCY